MMLNVSSSESLSLNFTKVEYKFIGMDETGKLGSPDTVTYDIGKAKVV